MAIKTITSDLAVLNGGKELTFTAPTSATDGFALDFTGNDCKTVVIFQNTDNAAKTVTIKQGNGIQGVADLDAFSIPAGGFAVFRLDSGAFKNVSGADTGNVVAIPSAVTIKACVIQLP